MNLFSNDYGVDNSPKDDTEITTTILYFSKEELKEFKQLCKALMKKQWPQTFQQEGNIPDLLLNILRKENENN